MKDYKKFRKEVKPVSDKSGVTKEELQGLYPYVMGILPLPSSKEMAATVKKFLKR